MIAFGYFLIQSNTINDEFVEQASKVVFNYALPALLFASISSSSVAKLAEPKVIAVGLIGTILVFTLLMIVAPLVIKQKTDRGVVIQGAFRSNMGIIGLAYCANAFGSEGLAYGSVYMGGLTILYNVLSVTVLNIYQKSKTSWTKIVKDIVTNPIILSIVLGLIASFLNIKLPAFVSNSIDYFGQLTLPLALICTGAALQFSTLKANAFAGAFSIVSKCIFYPFVLCTIAILIGIKGMALMVIFLMATCPTAAASYIMVRKIGGNHQLAAQIVALSTVLSVPLTLVAYKIIVGFV